MQDPNKLVPNIDGRQHSDWLFVEVNAAQLKANGGLLEVECPAGGTVINGFIDVLVAGNAATTDTILVGDPTDPDRYGTIDVKTAGRKDLTLPAVPFYYGKDGSTQKMRFTVAATGAEATAGRFVLAVQWLQLGKWYFTQG